MAVDDLPRLWGLVKGLRVPVQLGREAARQSRDLDVVAAGHADRLLSWRPRRLNPHRVWVKLSRSNSVPPQRHSGSRTLKTLKASVPPWLIPLRRVP